MIKLTAKELHQRLREEANKHAPQMGGGELNMLTNCDTTTSKTYLHTIPCKDMEYGKIVHCDVHSVGLVLVA